MEAKAKRDSEAIMRFIEAHSQFNAMYNAFIKGPEPGCGFMWTPDSWWVGEEKSAVKIVSNKVLDYDWDSSGYGYMMRMIQCKIKELPVATAVVVKDDLKDDEGKCAGDTRTGKGSPLYENDVENPEEGLPPLHDGGVAREFLKKDDGRAMASAYQQTVFGKTMDKNNKEALDVMAKKGGNEAAKHMMDMAGGDYARMRSMYG